ncbi:MAG: FAD-dependent oxidoreductase [Thermoanaerobaculia bacterium]
MSAGADLTILGGGPAGLAVARYAQAAGLSFVLLERSAELGGLCRTLVCGGHRYDTGAHRFHDRDPEVTADVRAWLGDELVAVGAPSQIWHRGRFIDFPPSPLNWIRSQGWVEGARVAAEIARHRLFPRPVRSFEDLATNRYGRRLGKPLLLDYSEKLWGRPAAELAPDVATRRLSGLALLSLLFEVFLPRRKSAHLDGEFLYPRSGYGAIADAMAQALPRASLLTGREVVGFELDDGRIRAVRCADGSCVAVGGRVVNTLPLTLVARFLGAALPEGARRAAESLSFRHVRIVFLRLAVPRCTANATVYLPDPRLAISRVSEPRNRSAALAPAGETALVAEIPCSTGDALVGLADEALAERAIEELASVGLLARAQVVEWRHHFLANAYPVYALGYRERLAEVERGVSSLANLDLLGRGGRFWYSHLHDQLRAARDYVRSLPASAGAGSEPTPSIAAHIRRSEAKLQ